MTKLFQNKILWIFIPALALLAAITISGYLNSGAEQLDTFQMTGNVLLGYNGLEETITIPDNVSVIGSSAFENNQIIKKVIIPDGVTKIGQGAFRGCRQLKEIRISDSVITIADSAFDGCENLESVSAGNGLSNLGNGVFSDCSALKDITFEKNIKFKSLNGVVTDTDETVLYQFLAGNGITSYKMPDTVTEIKPYAFWGCDNLKSIDFSSGLNKINAYAAAECSGLETVVLHEPVREICLGAFANDKSLKEIVLPVSVTNIHESAFTAVPKDLRIICQEGSFAENYAVSEEYTPDISGEKPSIHTSAAISVYEESGQASGEKESGSAEAIQNVLQPDENDISERNNNNENPVSNAGSLESNTQYNELGNSIIVSDRVFVMMDSPTEREHLNDSETALNTELSDTAVKIPDYEYYQNMFIRSLSDIQMPDTSVEIGKFAFARSSIESVEIPEGIKTIGYGAFYHADSLRKVEIPDTVTLVEPYAFYHTPWYKNWEDNAQEDFLIVGDGVLLAYKGTEQTVVIPENVKYISSYAFLDNPIMEEVFLPEGLLKIESYAFSGCKNLKKIEYLPPDETKDIHVISEENSFTDCPALN